MFVGPICWSTYQLSNSRRLRPGCIPLLVDILQFLHHPIVFRFDNLQKLPQPWVWFVCVLKELFEFILIIPGRNGEYHGFRTVFSQRTLELLLGCSDHHHHASMLKACSTVLGACQGNFTKKIDTWSRKWIK